MARRTTALTTLAAVIAGAWARRRFTRFEVVEESMAPALLPGDYLVAKRLRALRSRGEVVMFEHPSRPGFFLVKRGVGLPGERVSIEGGRVLIDGRRLIEPWADGPTTPDGEWQVGADELFVLGDARSSSADDSRRLGPVPDVEWQAVFRYWPLHRVGRPASLLKEGLLGAEE